MLEYSLAVGRLSIKVDSRKSIDGNQAKLVRCDPHARISSVAASANPSSNGVNTNLRNVGGASAEFESFVRVGLL
jgi:hypothetical protein